MSNREIETHEFAKQLLARRNEFVRFWLLGRLSIVWDTNRAVAPPVRTDDVLRPEPHDSEHVHDFRHFLMVVPGGLRYACDCAAEETRAPEPHGSSTEPHDSGASDA